MTRYRWIVLLSAIGMAVFAGIQLFDSPRPWYDEGIYLQAARQVSERGIFGIPLSPTESAPLTYITVGYPLLVPLAAVFGLFGASIETARLFMLGVMLLVLVAGSYLMRRMYGVRAGAWAAVLLATFAPFYGNGKNVMGEVPGLLYTLLACHALLTIERGKKDWKPWAVLGSCAALACATKPSFLVLIPAMLFGVWMIIKKQQTSGKELAAGAMAFMIGMGIWWKTQFGMAGGNVLGHYANPYGLSDLAGVVLKNIGGFFTDATPLYFLALAIGVGTLLWRHRQKLTSVEVVLAVFVLLTWAAYFRTAGWYRYFFLAHVLLILWIPMAMLSFKKCGQAVLAVCLIAQLFMIAKDPFPLYGAHWREARTYIQSLPKDARVLYSNAPEFAFFANELNYTQDLRITERVRLEPVSEEPQNFNVLFLGPNSSIQPPNGFYLEKSFGDVKLYTRTQVSRL